MFSDEKVVSTLFSTQQGVRILIRTIKCTNGKRNERKKMRRYDLTWPLNDLIDPMFIYVIAISFGFKTYLKWIQTEL